MVNFGLSDLATWYQGKRVSGAQHELRIFASIEEAIDAYLHKVNSGDAYDSLRDIPTQLRVTGRTPDGKLLADGLLNDSQRREDYVQEVKIMLDQYRKFWRQQNG